MVAAIVGAAGVAASLYSSSQQSDAADSASQAQTDASNAGIAQQNKQFDAIQKLLSPYVTAGTNALGMQQNIVGLNGPQGQAGAVSALQGSPMFQAMSQQGENAILQNASATGGLRGGNTQAALGQFRPALLNSLLQQQFANLGGLTSIGQNAAAGVGNAGMATGNNVTALLGQIGQAQAGNALAQGRAGAGLVNGVTGAAGLFGSLNGFGGTSYTQPNANGSFNNPGGAFDGYGIDQFNYLGGPATAGDYSDQRLKTDIEPLGIAPNGLPLYAFRYVWGGPRRIGHMAHEARERFPDAVSTDAHGYLMLDYSRVH